MSKPKIVAMTIFFILTVTLLAGTLYASEVDSTHTDTYKIIENDGYISIQEKISNDNTINTNIEDNKTVEKNSNVNKNTKRQTIYNDKSVVPSNTHEKNYTRNNTQSTNTTGDNIYVSNYTTLNGEDGMMPFYMNDNSTAICLEPEARTPHTESPYVIGTNHTLLNKRNGKK